MGTEVDRERAAERVVRGGSWNDNARNVRAAYRNRNAPDNRNDNLGFRCARAHARSDINAPEQVCLHGVAPPRGVSAKGVRKGVLVGLCGHRPNARPFAAPGEPTPWLM